jgi:hypothetical protein
MVMLGVEGLIASWKGATASKNASKDPLPKRHDGDEVVQPRSVLQINVLNILDCSFLRLLFSPYLAAEPRDHIRPILIISYSFKMELISCIMMGFSLVLSLIILQFL